MPFGAYKINAWGAYPSAITYPTVTGIQSSGTVLINIGSNTSTPTQLSTWQGSINNTLRALGRLNNTYYWKVLGPTTSTTQLTSTTIISNPGTVSTSFNNAAFAPTNYLNATWSVTANCVSTHSAFAGATASNETFQAMTSSGGTVSMYVQPYTLTGWNLATNPKSGTETAGTSVSFTIGPTYFGPTNVVAKGTTYGNTTYWAYIYPTSFTNVACRTYNRLNSATTITQSGLISNFLTTGSGHSGDVLVCNLGQDQTVTNRITMLVVYQDNSGNYIAKAVMINAGVVTASGQITLPSTYYQSAVNLEVISNDVYGNNVIALLSGNYSHIAIKVNLGSWSSGTVSLSCGDWFVNPDLDVYFTYTKKTQVNNLAIRVSGNDTNKLYAHWLLVNPTTLQVTQSAVKYLLGQTTYNIPVWSLFFSNPGATVETLLDNTGLMVCVYLITRNTAPTPVWYTETMVSRIKIATQRTPVDILALGSNAPGIPYYNNTVASPQFGPTSFTIPSGGWISLTDNVNTNFNFGTAAFTIEFWCYPNVVHTTAVGDRFIIAKGVNQTGAVMLGVSNGGVRLRLNVSTDSAYSATMNTSWHHIALVRNGNNFTVYVDGTSRISTSSTININAALPFQYGAPVVGIGSNFAYNGALTELRVSDIARYTSNFTPPTERFTNDANTMLLLHGDIDNQYGTSTTTDSYWYPNTSGIEIDDAGWSWGTATSG